MNITVEVPDSVARSLRLPESEIRSRLSCELALSLYAQDILPFGKAVELAGVSRYRFAELLTERGIPRHYSPDELAEDLDYGRGQEHPSPISSSVMRLGPERNCWPG